GNYLRVQGERKVDHSPAYSEFSYASFQRWVPLEHRYDPENVTATLENGILEIRFQGNPQSQTKVQIN
ncbi:MAG: Hsp20/alpha crystallin family protein, partial [Halobacteria archaeon]